MSPAPGVRLSVRLVPRGGRDLIEGVGETGELRCRVSAPPVEGAANLALKRLVATALGVPPSAVVLEAGAAARLKRLRVAGVTAADVVERWPGVDVRDG